MKENLPSVSGIVLNWNGKHLLEDCLQSLICQQYKEFEIILVDNGSNDESVQFVKTFYPSVKIISNPDNKGYCRAMNQGIEAAKGEYVWLLNNDIRVSSVCLSELMNGVKAVGSEKVIALFPKVYYWDNPRMINAFGKSWSLWRLAGAKGKSTEGQVDIGQYDKPRRIFGDIFVAPLFNRERLMEIGYFDEYFFSWAEDYDVSYRANLFGYEFYTCPDAVIYHKISQSGKGFKKQHYFEIIARNLLLITLKNYSARTLLFTLPYFFWRILVYLTLFKPIMLGFGARRGLRKFLWVLRFFYLKRKPILANRRFIQKHRKLSDRAICQL